MPVSKKKAAATADRILVRLKREGSHGEKGLKTFSFRGKKYTREGIYRVAGADRQYLLQTGHFEVVPPENLEKAKKEARMPRGHVLGSPTDPSMRGRRRVTKAPTVVEEDALEVENVGTDAPEGDDGGVQV